MAKGKTADKFAIEEEYNYRINEYLEDFMNASQLLLYDKKGVFQRKLNLPVRAKKVEFLGDKMFILYTAGGIPEIRIYAVK